MRPTSPLLLGLAWAAIALAGCGSGTPPRAADPTTTAPPAATCALPGRSGGSGTQIVGADGRDRRVLVALPDDLDPAPPLVLALHGHGGSAAEFDANTGLAAAGAARGIAVVTPQGEGDPRRWNFDRRPDGPDDYAFVDGLIADLVAGGCADPDRVVVAGSSNGAAFAGLLACTAPYRAAAVVMVIATVPTSCPPDVVPSILTVRGKADAKVPYAGTPELVAADAAHHGCDPTPMVDEPEAGVERTTYTGCRDGAEVTLVAVDGGTHTWFGGATAPSAFSATDAVLDLTARTTAR